MSAFELKRTVTQFSYRTEPKPGGGFIARPSDPSMETFEGATEQEVQQKVLGAITAALSQNGAVKILPANLAKVKLANVKVISRSTLKFGDEAAALKELNLDPSEFLEDKRPVSDAPPTPIQFERSKIFWPAIVVIVAVVVILYGILR